MTKPVSRIGYFRPRESSPIRRVDSLSCFEYGELSWPSIHHVGSLRGHHELLSLPSCAADELLSLPSCAAVLAARVLNTVITQRPFMPGQGP